MNTPSGSPENHIEQEAIEAINTLIKTHRADFNKLVGFEAGLCPSSTEDGNYNLVCISTFEEIDEAQAETLNMAANIARIDSLLNTRNIQPVYAPRYNRHIKAEDFAQLFR